MKLNKKHLRIYDQCEGKRSVLDRIGTPNEKACFENGEFEKITELIEREHKLRNNELSNSETQKHKAELNELIDSNWNKRSLNYLSKKYCEPTKEQSTFDSIMEMLWAIFG